MPSAAVAGSCVEFWDVGSSSSAFLPLSTKSIIEHIATDWSPGTPSWMSGWLFGWVGTHLEEKSISNVDRLLMSTSARYIDRQWKMCLSWLLGVGGTRTVLARENYPWVAPLSAFYKGSSGVALPPNWPARWLPGQLESRHSRGERPDYLAIRRLSGSKKMEFAVIEAKGRRQTLGNAVVCRKDWRVQVNNANLWYKGRPKPIDRRLIVATRVNPDGTGPLNRAIQIRAWNHLALSENPGQDFGPVAEVVAAHIFGLFVNLGLVQNAHAISLAVSSWAGDDTATSDRETVNERATRERQRVGTSDHGLSISLPFGMRASLDTMIIELARSIQKSEGPAAVESAIEKVDARWASEDSPPWTGISLGLSGV